MAHLVRRSDRPELFDPIDLGTLDRAAILKAAKDHYQDAPYVSRWRTVPSRGLFGRRCIEPGVHEIAQHAACLAQEIHLEPFDMRMDLIERAALYYSDLAASIEQFQMLLYAASIVGPWNCATYRYTQFSYADKHPSPFGIYELRSIRSVAFVEELAMRSRKTDLDALPANETADLARLVEIGLTLLEPQQDDEDQEAGLLLLSRAFQAAANLQSAMAPAITMTWARKATTLLIDASEQHPQITQVDDTDYSPRWRDLEFRGFEGWTSSRPAGW